MSPSDYPPAKDTEIKDIDPKPMNEQQIDAVRGGLSSSVLKKMSETSSGVQAKI